MDTIPYLFFVHTREELSQEFYMHEARFVLQQVGNRLLKSSFREVKNVPEQVLLMLFQTDQFCFVKLEPDGAILLHRRRGEMTVGFRLADVEKIRCAAFARKANLRVVKRQAR